MRRLTVLSLVSLWPACVSRPGASSAEVRLQDGRLVAALVAPGYAPAEHAATCKVFHHLFAPDGRLLTKGLGGKFEHHRGLFAGWNQMQSNQQKYDFWHCRRGETQRFVGFVSGEGLDLPATAQVAAIDWRTGDGRILLRERRALGAAPLSDDAFLLQLTIELTADDDAVVIDGDPQHAGQQFRALQTFADPGAPGVEYLRPPGAKGQANDVWTACAWIAAVLPLPDGPVTVLRCEGPDNPPATWSTRAYGRFGATCTTALAARETLRLDYHYVVAIGRRDVAWCERTALSIAGRRGAQLP